jgi:hypothetical protein
MRDNHLCLAVLFSLIADGRENNKSRLICRFAIGYDEQLSTISDDALLQSGNFFALSQESQSALTKSHT